MIRCLMVYQRDGRYHRNAEAEVEDWEEILDAVEGEPQLIESIEGWPPIPTCIASPMVRSIWSLPELKTDDSFTTVLNAPVPFQTSKIMRERHPPGEPSTIS
jgi:hypothetical protein